MMRKFIVTAILIFTFFLSALAQEVEYTKREKNVVREGPGNYFPLFIILPQGTPIKILKQNRGWIQFQMEKELMEQALEDEAKDLQTWIAENCLSVKESKSSLSDLDLQWQSIKASRSSVAAAIRGYALRYGQADQATLDSLQQLQTSSFTPQEYFRFRDETERLLNTAANRTIQNRDSSFFTDYDILLQEEGIGLGIASRIAANGLVDDPALVKYLNLLTTFLSEASGAYDVSFRCFVLNDSDIKAFSVPGGYIFNTKGMIDLCRDESEIAGIIAHEMMHIILKHGLKEVRQRPVQRKMDMVMHELEMETGEAPDSTELELENFALDAYENIMGDRIQGYEEEADQGAILLLAKVGYDVTAIPRITLRIRDAIRKDPDLEMENPFAHLDFENRYKKAMEFIQSTLPHYRGRRNQDRFNKYLNK